MCPVEVPEQVTYHIKRFAFINLILRSFMNKIADIPYDL